MIPSHLLLTFFTQPSLKSMFVCCLWLETALQCSAVAVSRGPSPDHSPRDGLTHLPTPTTATSPTTVTLQEHPYTCLLADPGDHFVGNIYPDMYFLDYGACRHHLMSSACWISMTATATLHHVPTSLPTLGITHLCALADLTLMGARHSLIVALVFVPLMIEFEQLSTDLVDSGVCFYELLILFTHFFLRGLSFYCSFVGAP